MASDAHIGNSSSYGGRCHLNAKSVLPLGHPSQNAFVAWLEGSLLRWGLPTIGTRGLIRNMATKPAWLYRQSAVIPFLKSGETLEVVLVTSKSSGDWIIPKGVIERDMTPGESAAEEALTEAGVRGIVSEKLVSEYEYQKWGGTCHVQVLKTWEEKNSRDRRIVEASEAVSLVKPLLRDVLNKFVLQNLAQMS